MDHKLLRLWRNFSSGDIRVEDIAESLQISQKQTGRYLKKWTEEQWLSFTPGRGRGNVSKLKWLKNIEEIYEEQVMKILNEEPLEKSSKYLQWDWSPDNKLRIMNLFYTKFGYKTEAQDKLLVPRRYPFMTIHPLEAADVHSASLVATLFNRLVAITPDGQIRPELAHSWDVKPGKLRLYLKKDIRFHDGSILTADDVVVCLERLKHHKHYNKLWSPVKKIVAVAPLIVDLIHPGGCSYSLHILSTMTASIYKENHGRLVGTGCFFLEENSIEKTTISAFKEYFQERPLLDKVEFIQVPKDMNIGYQSSIQQENQSTFQVESDSGFGVVIMNAYRDSPIQRKEVRDYLHMIIAKNRHTIQQYNQRSLPNEKSILIGQHQPVVIPVLDRPTFEKPIVLRITDHTEKPTLWLKEAFEKEGIPIDLKHVSFEDSINKSNNREIDIFIHGEIFELNQNLSFYFFLTNGYSPLDSIISKDEEWVQHMNCYKQTPFHDWLTLNLETEKKLIASSIMVPIYYEKRNIPFSSEIANINITHFGYVDFSKLWVRPVIER